MMYGRASRVVVCGLVLAGTAGIAAAQAPITVSGRVVGDNGTPLGDVSVELRSLGLGALTRSDGRYTLTVAAGRGAGGTTVSVTARRLGYRSETRQVRLPAGGGAVTLDFTLVSNPLQLGEIVVTGAGTASTAERLGTIRKQVESETITRANEVNLVTALAGKAAGVQVQQQSGEAGGGARIQIRGVRSVGNGGPPTGGAGQPMFVVDGVPINNQTNITGSAVSSTSSANRVSDINPNDIENIEILSGPAASAIYGSLAGNGVVLITTKKGRAGRTQYALRSNFQTDQVVRSLPFQRSFGVGSNGQSPACLPGGAANCSVATGQFFSWGPRVAAGTPTWNQVDELFSPGRVFDNTLQVSGGNDRTTFLFSGGALTQDGFYVTSNDFYRRYTGRLNGSHRAAENLTVSGNFNYSRIEQNGFGRGNNTNGMLLGGMRTPPSFDMINYQTAEGQQRTWRFPNPALGADRLDRGFDNPLFAVNQGETAPQDVDRSLGNVLLNWTPLSWLTVDYNLGADFTAEDRMEVRPVQASGAPRGGSLTRWQFNTRILDHNLTARANKSFGQNFAVRGLVGQQLNQQEFRQLFATGNELLATTPWRIDNTVQATPPTDQETKQRLEAYFGQVQFDLYNQLFVTLLARNEGSSTFGTESNRIWYPSAQLSWTVPDRLRFPGLSTAKLRSSYGESGIIPTAYQLQNTFLGGSNLITDFNPGSQVAPTVTGIGGLFAGATRGNNRLRPARVGEFELGADVAFLDNRIDAGVTYYVQQVRDGIISSALPPSTGFSSEVANVMKMRNIGLEVQANFRLVQSRDWQVEVGGNYAFNRNRVQDLGGPITQGVGSSFGGRATFAVVGEQLGSVRGSDWARCRPNQASNVVGGVDINAACQAANAPAGAVFIAANGFPVVDPTERTIGDPNPNYLAGARTNITWKRLNFNTFWDIRNGGTIQNMTKASMYQYGTHGDTEDRGADGLGRTGVVFGRNYRFGGAGSAEFPVVGPGAGREVTLGQAWFAGNGGIAGPPSQFQEDGSFVRLREITVGINLNQPWVSRRTGLSSIDVRVGGRNLGLWTDYTGFDPETSLSGGAVITQGFDWFNAPTSRSFVFTVSLNR